jgi:hypothetical protein
VVIHSTKLIVKLMKIYEFIGVLVGKMVRRSMRFIPRNVNYSNSHLC